MLLKLSQTTGLTWGTIISYESNRKKIFLSRDRGAGSSGMGESGESKQKVREGNSEGRDASKRRSTTTA